jgi:uncharacterized repeat protein (TIGR01451 family)
MRKTALIALTTALLALPASAAAVGTADLSIQMSDTPDPVSVGGAVTYTLVIHNGGPSTATGVGVFDKRPPGMADMGTTQPAGWSTSAGPEFTAFSNPSLADGETAVLTILMGPAPSGPFTNTANVQSGTFDLDLTNNTAGATTNQPLAAPTMALLPATATSPKKCKKRHNSAAAAKKKRCKKKR